MQNHHGTSSVSINPFIPSHKRDPPSTTNWPDCITWIPNRQSSLLTNNWDWPPVLDCEIPSRSLLTYENLHEKTPLIFGRQSGNRHDSPFRFSEDSTALKKERECTEHISQCSIKYICWSLAGLCAFPADTFHRVNCLWCSCRVFASFKLFRRAAVCFKLVWCRWGWKWARIQRHFTHYCPQKCSFLWLTHLWLTGLICEFGNKESIATLGHSCCLVSVSAGVLKNHTDAAGWFDRV